MHDTVIGQKRTGQQMKTQELRERIASAAAPGTQEPLSPPEINALLDVVEAAREMMETTLDRNVGRRRMESLQMALLRLERL